MKKNCNHPKKYICKKCKPSVIKLIGDLALNELLIKYYKIKTKQIKNKIKQLSNATHK